MNIIKNTIEHPDTHISAPPPKKESLWDIVKFMVLALVIVLPIRMFIAQPFLVQGRSMDPTLKNHDYLIVDELSYHLREPRRGEVIVFRFPGNPKEHFVKRVIGLPGDTLSIVNGKVTVTTQDNEVLTLDEPYVTNHSYESLVDITVPKDQLFVMGDNRSESYDSRMWKFLPRTLATGRALLRLYPFKTMEYLPGEHVYPDTISSSYNN